MGTRDGRFSSKILNILLYSSVHDEGRTKAWSSTGAVKGGSCSWTPLRSGRACGAVVRVNAQRLERMLAEMWAPMEHRSDRVVWSED